MDKNSAKKDYPKEQKHPWMVYIIIAIMILFPLTLFIIKHRAATKNRMQKAAPELNLQQQRKSKQEHKTSMSLSSLEIRSNDPQLTFNC